jgi:hypothetical protein
MVIVPCFEDTNKTNQKAADSLPITLPMNGCNLTFDLSCISDLPTIKNLSDVLELEDLTDETDGSDYSSDDVIDDKSARHSRRSRCEGWAQMACQVCHRHE